MTPEGDGEGRGHWETLDASHRRGLVIALACLGAFIGLVVIGVAVTGKRGTPALDVSAKVVGGPPADSTGPTGSAVPSASADATPGAPAAADTGTPPVLVGREPLVAYRQDGAVWVAREDGSEAIRVAEVRDGSFALSPDGKSLAAVDAVRGVLVLADVSSRKAVEFGGAMDLDPSWAPDSSWVAFTVDTPKVQVIKVRRDGSERRALVDGVGPKVSLDGARIAYLEAGTGRLAVAAVGSAGRVVPGVQSVSGYAWVTGDRLVYASPGPGPSLLGRVAPDGEGRVQLDVYSGTRPVTFAQLRVSPDGRWLAYAETGDDGYSRMWVIAWDGSGKRYLSVRRDDYPIGWSADGSRIVFVQGNAGQGDPTSLMEVRRDGTGRLPVVDGAGL